MKLKKLISAMIVLSMSASAVPQIGFAASADEASETETNVSSIQNEKEEITFTEYNDIDNKMYQVVGRNRLDAHTDAALPYQDERTALESARDYTKEKSERVKMLTGDEAQNQWDFTVVKNLSMAKEYGFIADGDGKETNPFAAPDYVPEYGKNDDKYEGGWLQNVKMPSSWTSYGAWWNNVNPLDEDTGKVQGNVGEVNWVWDYPIYNNVKMPWQGGEQPYNSDDQYTQSYGKLKPGEAPVKYNPIGFYRTSININDMCYNSDDRIKISFQGVESAYYVFIDGEAIGYSEDSYRPHEFDITDYLKDGQDHVLAVRVHKFSDSTWLEDQDMIYDGGIFRDVYLISSPAVEIADYKVETDFDDTFTNADLIIKNLTLKNNTDKDIPAGYEIEVKLYNKEDLNNAVKSVKVKTDKDIPANGTAVIGEFKTEVESPKQWSAEKPELYVMSLNTDEESTAQLVGFREINFTPHSDDYSSNESYDRVTINGQPLLMKGTNRHDSDPITGKYISKEIYDIDLKTMKQFNINTIRTSHYANDEYLYYLADTYGFYVMAETNAECHAVAQRDRGNADVYQDKLFDIFKDRTVSSYQSLKNHSSIVSWSIGNECGGLSDANEPVYYWMADYFHANDSTRPVHSEFVQNRERFDMESNMYPSVERVQSMASTPDASGSANKKNKPYFLCEYVHAMGNAVGDMDGYWDAIRSGTNMIGGCIWDWVDQSRIVPLSRVTSDDGTAKRTDANKNIVPEPKDYYSDGKYLAHEGIYGKMREGYFFGYGGDWGDVNYEGRNVSADGKASGSGSGQFCVNGLVSPDRQPQSELYQVKYIYQSFHMKQTTIYEQNKLDNGWTTDENLKNGQIVVYNENNFTNLDEYDMDWELTENGKVIGNGTLTNLPSVEPKAAGAVDIPFKDAVPNELKPGAEYRLNVYIKEKNDTWAVNAGHEIAHESLDLSADVLNAPIVKAESAAVGGDNIKVDETNDLFKVSGSGFSFDVSKKTGFMSNYVYNGETIIKQLSPNYTRGNHDNDSPMIDNWRYADEAKNITPVPNATRVTQGSDGRYVIDVGVKIKVPYDGDEYANEIIRYTVDKSGAVTYRIYLDTSDMPNQTAGGRYLLKVGSQLQLDKSYEDITWYGNGIKTGNDGEYGYNYPVTESYRDRNSFAVKGVYSSTATDMYFPHLKTQETGTVDNVTWAVMNNGKNAILVTANKDYKGKENDVNYTDNTLEVSALHYSAKDMRNGGWHPYEITSTPSYSMDTESTYFNVDHKSLGIGNTSCGPQARVNARLNTGYVFDYEYTIVPMSAEKDTDAYDNASISWNAAADTDVPDPAFRTEIGNIGVTTPEIGLPKTVTVNGSEQAVSWSTDISELETYEENTIIGTAADGSEISAKINVFPDNMYYFVDSDDDDTVYNRVKEISSVLKNSVNDQQEVKDGWGISSIKGTDYDNETNQSKEKKGDMYKTGYYLMSGKTLSYKFTLPAGKYTVTEGAYEFWNGNAARNIKVAVKTDDGSELGSAVMTIDSKNGIDTAKAEVSFELSEETVITVETSKNSGADPVMSWIGISQALPNGINAQDGIKASVQKAYAGETVTLTGSYADGSLFVNDASDALVSLTKNDDGTYSFVMPNSDVSVTGLVNSDTTLYVVPSKIERVRGGSQTDNRNYFIASDRGLGMTFEIPSVSGKNVSGAKLHFVRQNTAGGQKTNVYDQTADGFKYVNGSGYIAQYSGGTQNALELNWTPELGAEKKLMLAYDESVSASAAGNDYYVVGSNNNGAVSEKQLPTSVEQLPYIVLTLSNGGSSATAKPSSEPSTEPTAEPSGKVWSDYAENSFSGKAGDYSIVWKVTNNANDRKGASHTVDKDNKTVTITTNEGTEGKDVLYGVTAAIKNIQPNTKYTLKFKEKSDIKTKVSHGFYVNGMTAATTSEQTDPHSTKDTENLATKNNNYLHDSAVTDDDWHERTIEYVSGSGLPQGYDTYEAKFTFIIRGVTGSVQIKDLEIVGASAPEPTPTPSPIPAPTKDPNKDYTPKVNTGSAIDPLNTNEVFQYHFAGGTDDYMSGKSETGKKYDAYMWVPKNVTSENLRGLVAIKMNLIEVPLAYSVQLKESLAKQNFGILFIVDENDAVPEGYTGDGKNYKNILQGMYTSKDYKGDDLFTASKWKTWDGKDAADIMNDIMNGIAKASGYTCVAENTPIITIGHSAASPFGYRSGNWAYNRVIAQIDMKNGMWGDCTDGSNADNDAHGFGMVPGIPSLQLAAQYTEHSIGAGRDRSICDARYHIDHQRAADENQLVSHIIEWGSGHYDWSNNATDIMTKYIDKAIEYRLNKNADGTDKGFKGGSESYVLTDLTGSGYLMKPFEKDENGSERAAGYYRDTLKGWLSSGKENSAASEEDKKSSFWYFDKELADEINSFTNYAIPESPAVNDTKVSGKTHSDYEPYMLMKNPSASVYADTKYDFNSYISPFAAFSGGMSRYGDNRFINYEKMSNPSEGNGDSNPSVGATNTGSLKGYDTVTVDTYYMSNVPSIGTLNGEAYDGVGDKAAVPADTKAEVVPLIAPYELVNSELVDINTMVRDGSQLADEVASVTRNTLRFHNNRVYYNSGCKYTNEAGSRQGAFSMIYSPEVRDEQGNLVSAFKSTGTGMNVPYVDEGKGENQSLKLSGIEDINVSGLSENPRLKVNYTSSDADLQKYTDVFVNYGPAKAVRTVNPTDGSYTWEIEILLDEIPVNAKYPIEVSVVASNLGKWEKVSGATDETIFNIVNDEPEKETKAVSVTINSSEYSNNLPAEGTLTAVNMTRNSDDSLEGCVVYAALYNENRLVGVSSASITEFTGSEKQIILSQPIDISGADEVRVYVWDNNKPKTSVLNIK